MSRNWKPKPQKAPTTDPACKDRYRHHNGQKCETCGGVG